MFTSFFCKFSSSHLIYFLQVWFHFFCLCYNLSSMLKVFLLCTVILHYLFMIKCWQTKNEMGGSKNLGGPWWLCFTICDSGILFARECICPLVAQIFREFFSSLLPGRQNLKSKMSGGIRPGVHCFRHSECLQSCQSGVG